jgi:NADH-quinone oxidoreductase subunit H
MEEIIQALAFLMFFLVLAFATEWVYRKTVARVQKRYGPLHTGFAGILQPLADFLKLMTKEDLGVPEESVYFKLAPILLVFIPLMALYVLPLAGAGLSFDGDIIFLLILFNAYVGIVWLFSSSLDSRFANVGAMRQSTQFFSFEVPFILSLAAFAIHGGSLSLSGLKGFDWLLVPSFLVFMVASLGKLRKLPFDAPTAGQEIATGIEVELSGRKLALFRLGENLEFVFVAGLGAVLLFGPPASILLFIVEFVPIVILFSIVSALFPRYRIDQVSDFFWRYMTALALCGVILSYF